MLALLFVLAAGPGSIFFYDAGYWPDSNKRDTSAAVIGFAGSVAKHYKVIPAWCVIRGHLEVRNGKGDLEERPDILVCEVYEYSKLYNEDGELTILRGKALVAMIWIDKVELLRLDIPHLRLGRTMSCGEGNVEIKYEP